LKCGMRIAEFGLKKKSKKRSEIPNPQSEIRGALLFLPNAPAFGPGTAWYLIPLVPIWRILKGSSLSDLTERERVEYDR